MTYTAYDVSKPNPSLQAGTAELDSSRYNMQALRDCIATLGLVQGFDYSIKVGDPADKPTEIYYKRSTEWIKLVITWGTTGGATDNVEKIAFYYSSNSGTGYDAMADTAGEYVLHVTYDANGNVTATSWDATP